jgi:3-hydroxyisobutyrate dehydrogenase-like beta-hydroxyacid dehydrogenase
MNTSAMPPVGMIGLGALGSAIAERLITQGIALTVWNRSPQKITALIHKGATGSPTIEGLCQHSEWVLSCVSDDEAMQKVNAALCAAGHKPSVHLSFSSCSPKAVRQAAKQAQAQDICFINCPVLGRPDVVLAGMAGYLVAGKKTASKMVEPLLSKLGENHRYLGEKPEQSAVVKLVMNYFIALTIGGLTEAVSTLEQQGISFDIFLDIVDKSPASSRLIGLFGSLIAAQKFSPPLFDLRLAQKDINYFTDLTGNNPDLFLAAGIQQHIIATKANSDAPALDWAGLASHLLAQP